MIFAGIQQFTMVDYPWHQACVLFTLWCNMRCPYCHNPELVLPDRIKKMKPYVLSEWEILWFLESRRGLLDWVSICGWEPTLHKDLPKFVQAIKALWLKVKLDTNWSNAVMVDALLDAWLVDYVAVDMKHVPDKYHGVRWWRSPRDFRTNYNSILARLKQSDIEYEYRTTVIDWMHTKEDILHIASLLAWVENRYIQTYVPGSNLEPWFVWKPFSKEQTLHFQELATRYIKNVSIRW